MSKVQLPIFCASLVLARCAQWLIIWEKTFAYKTRAITAGALPAAVLGRAQACSPSRLQKGLRTASCEKHFRVSAIAGGAGARPGGVERGAPCIDMLMVGMC